MKVSVTREKDGSRTVVLFKETQEGPVQSMPIKVKSDATLQAAVAESHAAMRKAFPTRADGKLRLDELTRGSE